MPELKTSFIPKKPIIKKEVQKSGSSLGLFLSISIIIFFISLLTASGLYFYKAILEKNIETMTDDLNRAKEAIEPSLIASLKRLDSRIDISDSLIGSHLLISPIFLLLEDLTLKSVQYDRFGYTAQNDGGITLFLSGKARGYSSLALQSEVFANNINIEEPKFTNLGLDERGSVSFNFSSPINKNFLLFRNNILNTNVGSSF